MKFRVVRFFPEEPEHVTLIGHFDTKRQASNAISDDQYGRKVKLEYKIDPVEEELTQAQIDELFRQFKRGLQP